MLAKHTLVHQERHCHCTTHKPPLKVQLAVGDTFEHHCITLTRLISNQWDTEYTMDWKRLTAAAAADDAEMLLMPGQWCMSKACRMSPVVIRPMAVLLAAAVYLLKAFCCPEVNFVLPNAFLYESGKDERGIVSVTLRASPSLKVTPTGCGEAAVVLCTCIMCHYCSTSSPTCPVCSVQQWWCHINYNCMHRKHAYRSRQWYVRFTSELVCHYAKQNSLAGFREQEYRFIVRKHLVVLFFTIIKNIYML